VCGEKMRGDSGVGDTRARVGKLKNERGPRSWRHQSQSGKIKK